MNRGAGIFYADSSETYATFRAGRFNEQMRDYPPGSTIKDVLADSPLTKRWWALCLSNSSTLPPISNFMKASGWYLPVVGGG